jgi:hypothetical protein
MLLAVRPSTKGARDALEPWVAQAPNHGGPLIDGRGLLRRHAGSPRFPHLASSLTRSQAGPGKASRACLRASSHEVELPDLGRVDSKKEARDARRRSAKQPQPSPAGRLSTRAAPAGSPDAMRWTFAAAALLELLGMRENPCVYCSLGSTGSARARSSISTTEKPSYPLIRTTCMSAYPSCLFGGCRRR